MRTAFQIFFALVTVVAALLSSGCASGPGTAVARLTYDAEVLRPGKPPRQYKNGQLVDVGDEPMWIRGEGFAHVVIIPAMKADAEPVEIFSIRSDALAENSGGRACLGQRFQESLGEVLSEVNVAQVLLRAGRREEAFDRVEALAERYPGVRYLQLLRASVLTALGRRQQAEEALASFLEKFPDDTQALALQNVLERARPAGPERMIASDPAEKLKKPKRGERSAPAPETPSEPATEPVREPRPEAAPAVEPETRSSEPHERLDDIQVDTMRLK